MEREVLTSSTVYPVPGHMWQWLKAVSVRGGLTLTGGNISLLKARSGPGTGFLERW